jgi:hypothetical protein
MQRLKLKLLKGIHLVDKGAAIGARVIVMKRNAEERAMSLKDRLIEAVRKAVEPVLKEVEPEKPKFDFAAFVKAYAEIQKEEPKSQQELIDAALAKLPDEDKAMIMALIGAAHQMPPPAAAPEPPAAPEKQDEPEKPEPEEVVPEKADDNPEGDDMPEKKPDVEKAMKDLNPEAKVLFEKVLGEKADAEKRLEDVEKALAEQTAERELAEQVEVSKQFLFVTGDVAKRAALLLSVKKNDGEDAYNELVRTLKSADEIAKKANALDPRGTSRGDGGDADTAYAKLRAMASELVAKADKPLSLEQALKRIQKTPEGRKLYVQARSEDN